MGGAGRGKVERNCETKPVPFTTAVQYWFRKGARSPQGLCPQAAELHLIREQRHSSGEIQLSSQDDARSPRLPYQLHNPATSSPVSCSYQGRLFPPQPADSLPADGSTMQAGKQVTRSFYQSKSSVLFLVLLLCIFPPTFVYAGKSLKRSCFY